MLCAQCKQPFEPRRSGGIAQRYCSLKCRRDAHNAVDYARNRSARRESQAAYYREHAEEIKRGMRGRKRGPERSKQKQKAREAVTYALRTGRLVRQPCEVCEAERTEAHHPDYDRPLDVRWLCSTHHGEEHRRINVAAHTA